MSTFFKQLEQIADKVELQFNIKSKDGLMTVMVTPKSTIKDSAFSNIKPLIISGTAEELDNDFLGTITTPLEKAAGIIHNIATFEAGSDKLAKENDAAKKQADQAKKEKEERNKKYAALMTKADTFEKDNNLKTAISVLKQAKEFTDKPDSLDKRINDLMAKLSQGSIFDAAPAEEDKTDYLADYKEEPIPDETEPIEEEELTDPDDQEGVNE